MNSIKFLVYTILIGVFFSCNTVKMEKNKEKESPTIVYSKGPCFGQCPIFTLTIYNTGLVKFHGRKFTDMDGKYQKQLKNEEYVSIVKAFRKNRFWRFDDAYNMDLVDAATTTISFSDENKSKTVKGKTNFPIKFEELRTMLDTLIQNKDNWIQTDKPKINPKDTDIIDNQIIIKITKSMILSRWLQENRKHTIKLQGRVGNDNRTWLIRFDKNKIKPEAMLKMLREDKNIESAEFNTKTSSR